MNIFLAILADIVALIAPYLVLFIILSFCANKHNVTARTLINRYSEVGDLFSLILGLQIIFLIVAVIGVAGAFFIEQDKIITLLDCLLAFAFAMIFLEIFAGIPFLMDECKDAIRKAFKDLPKRQIKL